MPLFEDNYHISTKNRYFGPAKVCTVQSSRRLIFVSLEDLEDYTEYSARLAIPHDVEIANGDEVLVSGEDTDHLYVIGILNKKGGSGNKQLRISNGVTAEVEDNDNSENLNIRNNKGQLLVQFDSRADKCTIYAPSGNIDFAAPEGSITFQAAEDIRIEGQHKISIHSNDTIHLIARDAGGNRAQVGLNSYKADISSAFLNVTSRRGQINIKDATYSGEYFRGTIKKVRIFIDRMDSSVNTIREKAKNVYKYVEGLLQTKSGRSRTLVESSSYLKAKRIYEKAEEDVKIDGNKIHLG